MCMKYGKGKCNCENEKHCESKAWKGAILGAVFITLAGVLFRVFLF